VPIFRGVNAEGGQTLSSAYGEQPWFGDAFSPFTGNPNNLPVDTHEMVAMVAPRGLFIMENPHIANLAPKSGSVAALGGAEVYKALGAGDNITYWSDVQNGTHCSIRPEWTAPLQQNIAKFLRNTANTPGSIRIASKALGNLSQWRDWTTPTLTTSTGQPTTVPPTTTPPTSTPPTSTPPTSTPPTTTPPAGTCSATLRDGTRWSDRFNTEVTVTGPTNNWTVVLALTSPQSVSSVWNGTYTYNSSTRLVTVKANGSGNVFGITTTANGNFTRPQVRSCTTA
jgi:hypothetical protein